eukprot:g1434.t1
MDMTSLDPLYWSGFAADSPGVRVGLATYIVIVGAAVAAWLPFEVCDKFGLFSSYRVQPDLRDKVTEVEHARLRALCVQMVRRNLLVLLPLSLAGGPLLRVLLPFDGSGSRREWLGAALLWQLPVFFLVDDVCFYAYHRMLHADPALYRRFHKQHHEFKLPFALASHATHPVEMLLQAVGAMLGPLLLAAPRQTFWLWLVVRQWQGIEDHCGYELPFAPSRFAPSLFGGAPFHDIHHSKNMGNYASCFPFIDDLFGTRFHPGKGKGKGKGTDKS